MSDQQDRHRHSAADGFSAGDDAGWENYHGQMFDLASAPNAFIRWRIKSTGVNIARALMAARNRGRSAWTAEHGPDPTGWPLPHPPAVLWLPYAGYAACLQCTGCREPPPAPRT